MAISLNRPMINPSSCVNVQDLARQVNAVFESLGFPGPPQGPDEPAFDLPYQTRTCLTSHYTDGVATAVYVDEYYRALPGQAILSIFDPTRRRGIGGTVEIVAGAVIGSDTTFADWSTNATMTIDVNGTALPVDVLSWQDATHLTLVDNSVNMPVGTGYVLREKTGSLEGTGNGTCGYVPVVSNVTHNYGSGSVPEAEAEAEVEIAIPPSGVDPGDQPGPGPGTGGGGTSGGQKYIAGDGINIYGSIIKTDLADLSGLEYDTGSPGNLRSKRRFGWINGLATQDYHPSSGSVSINNIAAIDGETPVSSPTEVVTARAAEPIWVDSGDLVYARWDLSGTGTLGKWDVTTAYNLPVLLRGMAEYDDEEIQYLTHEGQGQVEWREGPEGGDIVKVILEINGAFFDPAANPPHGDILCGVGSALLYEPSPGPPEFFRSKEYNRYIPKKNQAGEDVVVEVFNMVRGSIGVGTYIQIKKVTDGSYFVDTEGCH